MKLKGDSSQVAGGVICVWTPYDAFKVLRAIEESGQPVAVDCEFQGVDLGEQSPVGHGKIACWSLAYFPRESLGTHPLTGTRLAQRVFVPNWGVYEHTLLQNVFRPWLESSYPKVGHNFTTIDQHLFENHGIKVNGLVCDTLRLSRLDMSSSEINHDLKYLINLTFEYKLGSFKSLFSRPAILSPKHIEKDSISVHRTGPLAGVCVQKYTGELGVFSWSKQSAKVLSLVDIPELYPQRLETLIDYATLDAKGTLELWDWFENHHRLGARGTNLTKKTIHGTLKDYYYKAWHPSLLILNRMERTGVRLDTSLAVEKASIASADLQEYDRALNDWAGKELNWQSGPQVTDFLYNVCGFPTPPIKGTLKAIKKTDDGDKPWAEASLHWLEMWAAQHNWSTHKTGLETLRRRKKCSRYLTYLESFPKLADDSGRLHTVLAPETDTGRLSAKLPPLQQVPADDPYKIRECFIPTAGHKLIVCDYSQLEIYILAHILLRRFNDSSVADALASGDVYGSVAKMIWPDKLANISANEMKHSKDPEVRTLRKLVKSLVLACNYGKGALGLALSILDDTGQPHTEEYGKQLLNQYFAAMPGIERYIRWIHGLVEAQRGVPTLAGRWRPIFDARQAAGKRKAQNSPIQGGAADILTSALGRVNPWDCTGVQCNKVLQEAGCVPVLQIHDELVFECPEESAKASEAEVVQCMEGAYPNLLVQLKVESKICNNWAEGK